MKMKKYLLVMLVCLSLCAILLTGCGSADQNAADLEPADEVVQVEPIGPLPAALVETDPMPGSELGVNAEITFYF